MMDHFRDALPQIEPLGPDDLVGTPDLFADFEALPEQDPAFLDQWRWHPEVRIRALQAGYRLAVDQGGLRWRFYRGEALTLSYWPVEGRWKAGHREESIESARGIPELLGELYPVETETFPRIFTPSATTD